MYTINLNEENKFVLHGLDDDCFMIVCQIIVNNDIGVPIIFKGTVFQVDVKTNEVNKLGEDYNVQTSLSVDAFWQNDNR